MQLSLFEWDILAVGKGLNSLARLDFHDARSCFSSVLEVLPENTNAGRAMEDLQAWEGVFRDMEGLAGESALSFFWNKIVAFPFRSSEIYQTLRQSLIKHLLTLLDGRATLYIPPDLCSGYLYLQLSDYSAAESHLRILVKSLPENGRLQGYLADAIWMQGRREIANAMYAKALLLAPHEVSVAELCNRGLADLIKEHGPAITPVYGFLEGVLPLVEQEAPPVTLEARSYEFLQQAEHARRLGKHNEMVAARRGLKNLAPEVLQDYLDFLVGS